MSRLPKVYRVYSFETDPKAVSAEFLKAQSDEEAIERTRSAGFGSKCEIWDGNRLVAQLERERAVRPRGAILPQFSGWTSDRHLSS